MSIKKTFPILCAALFLLYTAAAAQTTKEGTATIILNPLSPGPDEEVTAELRGFSFDINASFITWTRNGSISLSGTGSKSFKFRTGAIGKKEVISATARTIDGKEITATTEFLLGDVDLLWKADTTIPPEYKGKALPSPFSSIAVVAIPHFSSGGFTSSVSDLEFEWLLDGKRDESASGTGKNTYRFTAGASPTNQEITAKVKNNEKDISFEKSVFIPVHQPEVFLYEERPLEGPFMNVALSQKTLHSSEIKAFRAVPYFFPEEDTQSLSYTWSQNGEEKKTSPVHIFQFSSEKSGRQTITLEVLIQNTKHTIQKALAKIAINVQ
ncbi:MAG: hypothetical protein COU47_02425 [Candidatus Niyogibacteria bacterium CG10_big_fil_rev_8_21_14_0_10_46_36]|uniref:Ig-like domain-containing protein n=1 Tax=Candidatus Niyogibacteria bacterium CG10_big_fil_rev_8_21_14_0_10_46_36 TaxID=1974726 RepID=A0A2H0TDE6_9BACT|nr:MAG: hypothetical protein COU47_02425 [Candidatus Niyogibacteria bacterium CG10_big_fil_rev_8_21_14_0_10_46_36]